MTNNISAFLYAGRGSKYVFAVSYILCSFYYLDKKWAAGNRC